MFSPCGKRSGRKTDPFVVLRCHRPPTGHLSAACKLEHIVVLTLAAVPHSVLVCSIPYTFKVMLPSLDPQPSNSQTWTYRTASTKYCSTRSSSTCLATLNLKPIYISPPTACRAAEPPGEMDDSYKFEEEDVNARGGGGDGEGAGDDTGGGGKTPKLGRKKSFGKKKGGPSGSSSSAKKGSNKRARKS